MGRARRAGPCANNGDGRAVEADESIDALDDDTEKAKESRHGRVASLKNDMSLSKRLALRECVAYTFDRVAALDGTSVAVASGLPATGDIRGGGDRKDGEGKGCEGSELREHVC